MPYHRKNNRTKTKIILYAKTLSKKKKKKKRISKKTLAPGRRAPRENRDQMNQSKKKLYARSVENEKDKRKGRMKRNGNAFMIARDFAFLKVADERGDWTVSIEKGGGMMMKKEGEM